MNSTKDQQVFTKEQGATVDEAIQQVWSQAGIETLPREVLLKIFSYLGEHTLMNTLPQVCKEWLILSFDPSLFRKLTLSGFVINHEVDKFLQYAPWLESIELINLQYLCFYLTKLLNHANGANRLRSLTLTHESFHLCDIPSMLSDGFLNMPMMHTLILNGPFNFDNKFFILLGDRLKHLKVLHLGLMAAKFLEQCGMTFAEHCPPFLEKFVYTIDSPSRVNASMVLIEMISTLATRLCRTLRILHIYGCMWAPEDLECLKQCCQLQEFVVTCILHGRLEMFGSWQSLRHLEIISCHAPESDWLRLCNTTALGENLEVFRASGLGLTDKVATLIGTNFKNLRKLGLSLEHGEEIASDGLMNILKGCTQLKELSLLPLSGFICSKRFEPLRFLPNYLPGLRKLIIPLFSVLWIRKFLQVEMPYLDSILIRSYTHTSLIAVGQNNNMQ